MMNNVFLLELKINQDAVAVNFLIKLVMMLKEDGIL